MRQRYIVNIAASTLRHRDLEDAIKQTQWSLGMSRQDAKQAAEACRQLAAAGFVKYDEEEFEKEAKEISRKFIAHKCGKRGRY
ncbi:hypothetical protein P4305_18920 [Bacillus thuringiensis]|nr:hypothetical protein [Bacillus thuringiensis]